MTKQDRTRQKIGGYTPDQRFYLRRQNMVQNKEEFLFVITTSSPIYALMDHNASSLLRLRAGKITYQKDR
jgi:hypothetical protein